MRKTLILSLFLVSVVAVAGAQEFLYYTGEYGAPGPPLSTPEGGTSITQSNDTSTITPGNSVHCGSDAGNADNSYIRRFLLNADHGIVDAFTVESVDWAIESATGVTQTVNVSLYSIPTGSPLTFANLNLIDALSIQVTDTSLSFENTPVGGVISDPTTTDLVVEVFTPDGQADGNFLFIGSNPNGQTQPSYLAAPDCGAPEPTNIADLGFPDMHVIMVVNGTEGGGPVPTMGGWQLALLVALMAGIAVWVMRRRSAFTP